MTHGTPGWEGQPHPEARNRLLWLLLALRYSLTIPMSWPGTRSGRGPGPTKARRLGTDGQMAAKGPIIGTRAAQLILLPAPAFSLSGPQASMAVPAGTVFTTTTKSRLCLPSCLEGRGWPTSQAGNRAQQYHSASSRLRKRRGTPRWPWGPLSEGCLPWLTGPGHSSSNPFIALLMASKEAPQRGLCPHCHACPLCS